jgi:hypothetical protein
LKIYEISRICGISNVWVNHQIDNTKWLKAKINLSLSDQSKQNWQATVQTSPKALNYRIYKHELLFENNYIYYQERIHTLSVDFGHVSSLFTKRNWARDEYPKKLKNL